MTERGFDGQLLKQRYKKGSYAEEKFKILQEERKKFNVDAFGRYKGGCTVAFLIIFFQIYCLKREKNCF